MTEDANDRFDRLLKAMVSGPPPNKLKGDEQPQRTRERKPKEKPE